jgi:hypothetical protein
VRYLLLILFLSGCSSYPVHRTGIVHDYIFINATKMCESHGGLHYIVSDSTIFAKSSERYGHGYDYPCEDKFLVRCQDQVLLNFYDGVAWCFISESQLQETLPPPAKPNEHLGRSKL